MHNCISGENMSLYGSTLDHLLFIIYISPLKYIIEQTPNMKCYIYADDIHYAETCHHAKLILCANNIRK